MPSRRNMPKLREYDVVDEEGAILKYDANSQWNT